MKNQAQKNTINSLIKRYFYFILDEYQITEIELYEFGMFWVILNGKCQIKIGRDREGEIYMDFTEIGTPSKEWKKWSALDVLIYYLTNRKVQIFKEKIDISNTEFQMERLSRILKEYLSKIESFFVKGNFSLHKKELNRLRHEIDNSGYIEFLRKSNRTDEIQRIIKIIDRQSESD